MEFKNSITLYAKQKKRHRYTEQTFGLCGRRQGWDVLRDQHWTCILSRVKQITSPGWMHETSVRGWCTGMTLRDGMGREAGGGFRMGNTCTTMAAWQNPLQYCKVISLQLKLIKYKNKIKTKKKKKGRERGTRISFRSGFLGVYAQEWDCWVKWQFCFQFFKESPHSSP